MAEYGKVYKKIWNNGKFQALSEKAKYLFLYIITSPHSTVFGLFRLPIGYISGDLSWQPKTVLKYLGELQKSSFLLWEQKSFLVVIPSWLEHNPIKTENQLKKGLAELSEIPKNLDFLIKLKEMAQIHTNEYHKIIVKEIEESYLSSSLNHSYSEAVTEAEAISPENSGNPMKDSKKKKASTKATKDNRPSLHSEIVAHFDQKYQDRYHREYPFDKNKGDFGIIKDIAEKYSRSDAIAAVDQLFEDDWYDTQGRTIKILRADMDKLLQKSALKERRANRGVVVDDHVPF